MSEVEREIGAIIASVHAQLDAFDEIKLKEIEGRHPELMPQLHERLVDCLILKNARAAAPQEERESCDASSEIPKLRFDRYQILQKIGHGGQGTVYRAVQSSPRRVVALKVYHVPAQRDPNKSLRMQREVQLTARLKHRSIVKIIEAGYANQRFFHVMEYIEGLSITDHVKLENPGITERLELFLKVADAVDYAHRNGVIHRDLKPTNILVDSDGTPFILDLGLAKLLDANAMGVDDPHSIPGTVVGTPPYMSPEQITNSDEVDVRCDVYSLGIILGELLTGSVPFSLEGSPSEVRQRILCDPPLSLSAMVDRNKIGFSELHLIGIELSAVFRRSIERRPENRYQSVSALADDVRRFLNGDVVSVLQDRVSHVARKLLRRYRVHAMIAGGFTVLVVATAVFATASWMRAENSAARARASASIAQDVLSDVVTELDEELGALAGGMQLRDRLLDGVENRLAELEPLVESDSDLSPILMEQLQDRGRIAMAQGRKQAARGYFEKALGLQNGTIAPGEDGALAGARLERLIALTDEDSLARLTQLAVRLSEAPPDWSSASAKTLLATVYIDCARGHFYRGDFLRCGEQAQYAIAELRPLVRNLPSSINLNSMLAQALEYSGVGALNTQGPQAARQPLDESLQIRRQLIKRRSFDVQLQESLMQNHIFLATANEREGLPDETIAELNEAVRIGMRLTESEPSNMRWKRGLSAAHMRLASCYFRAKRIDEAYEHSAVAVGLSQSEFDTEPSNNEAQISIAGALSSRGQCHLAAGRLQEALGDMTKAHEFRLNLLDADPNDLRAINSLAATYSELGRCYDRLEMLDAAVNSAKSAWELQREAYDRSEESIYYLDVLISNCVNYSKVLIRRNKADDLDIAERVLGEAQALLSQVMRNDKQALSEPRLELLTFSIRKNLSVIEKRRLRAMQPRPAD